MFDFKGCTYCPFVVSPLLHVAAVEAIPVAAVHRGVMWLSPVLLETMLPPLVMTRLRSPSEPIVSTDQGVAANGHYVQPLKLSKHYLNQTKHKNLYIFI